jgi:hypothetical protein
MLLPSLSILKTMPHSTCIVLLLSNTIFILQHMNLGVIATFKAYNYNHHDTMTWDEMVKISQTLRRCRTEKVATDNTAAAWKNWLKKKGMIFGMAWCQNIQFQCFNSITEIFQNKTVKMGLEAGCKNVHQSDVKTFWRMNEWKSHSAQWRKAKWRQQR